MCYQYDRLHRQRTYPNTNGAAGRTERKGGNPGVVLALVLFALLGGGAAFYYFKFLKPKQNVKGDTDLEDLNLRTTTRTSRKQIPGKLPKMKKRRKKPYDPVYQQSL